MPDPEIPDNDPRYTCPECIFWGQFILPNYDMHRKSACYDGYTYTLDNGALSNVKYKWFDFPGNNDSPLGGTVSEQYNCNADASWAFYTDEQGCVPGFDPTEFFCPSGTETFMGLKSTPTDQACTIANTGSSSAANSKRYDATDFGFVGCQEWAVFPGWETYTPEYGAIVGHARGAETYAAHSAKNTRGPRLGFRWIYIPPSPPLPYANICLVDCMPLSMSEVGDAGFDIVFDSQDIEQEQPIHIPAIAPDVYNRGFINEKICPSTYLVTNAQYTEFLNTIAKNDVFGGEDLELWHYSMLPAISRTEHPDPIHKYFYSCNPKTANLPVTNVNLIGASYYIKWMNAFWCKPFVHDQQSLDSNPALSNCDDCIEAIDLSKSPPPKESANKLTFATNTRGYSLSYRPDSHLLPDDNLYFLETELGAPGEFKTFNVVVRAFFIGAPPIAFINEPSYHNPGFKYITPNIYKITKQGNSLISNSKIINIHSLNDGFADIIEPMTYYEEDPNVLGYYVEINTIVSTQGDDLCCPGGGSTGSFGKNGNKSGIFFRWASAVEDQVTTLQKGMMFIKNITNS